MKEKREFVVNVLKTEIMFCIAFDVVFLKHVKRNKD